MSQDNDTLRRDIPEHELAAMRLQKLEQQKKRKRKENRRPGAVAQILFMGSLHLLPGLRNPFLRKKVSEAHLRSGIHSALGTVSCGGDGTGEHGLLTPRTEAGICENLGLQSPFLSWFPDNSDPELEDVSVENGSVSPSPFKQSPRIRRKDWQARQRPGNLGDIRMKPGIPWFMQQIFPFLRRRSKTCNYLISLDPTDLSRDGDNFVGKVSRSNIFGTKFTIFDNGVNPDREHLIENTARIRRELGAVCYEHILGDLGPRKMTVILPGTNSRNQRIDVQPRNERESLLSRYQRGEKQGLLLLHSKTPLWNEENGIYTLNFDGRVTQASVKNFQIMDPKHPEHLVLQFGRVGPDTFTMDFCFPFSPLQAFGICLSSFG
uniref:Tubby C-terminal domain-containing protein n=1 Tax=Colobus angolensis palliatus TaxID=336983 RepID=A0A2K5KFH3_COLAP